MPKTLFLERFCISSLKNSLDHFNSWFETYFPPYSRQFTSNIDKEKVCIFLRIQFRQHFILQLSKHLPESIPSKNLTLFKSDERKHLVLLTFIVSSVITNYANTLTI